jgi:hypothetical protein
MRVRVFMVCLCTCNMESYYLCVCVCVCVHVRAMQGKWDPSLMFVMGGALTLNLLLMKVSYSPTIREHYVYLYIYNTFKNNFKKIQKMKNTP